MADNLKTATFAGGCFWCTEAIFQRLEGVESVVPGYAGGDKKNPSYEEVSGEGTGHAETTQIKYDSNKINYEKLADVFFRTHNPTELNRQGPDVGTQYRSIVFYHDDEQKEIAQRVAKKVESEGVYEGKFVTSYEPFKGFFIAEDYHKNYYNKHKDDGYSKSVIAPKLEKLEKHFAKDLKKTTQ